MATTNTNSAPSAPKFDITERYISVLPEIVTILQNAGVDKAAYDAYLIKAKDKVETDPKYVGLNLEQKSHKYEMLIFGKFRELYPTVKFPGRRPKIIGAAESASPAGMTGQTTAGPPAASKTQKPPTYTNVLQGTRTRGVSPKAPTPEARRREAEALDINKRDAIRAKNRGPALLLLEPNGLPQYSVVCFDKPKPENLFQGKDGCHIRWVQAHFDNVLFRNARLSGKFVAWVEPERELEKENSSVIEEIKTAKRLVVAWERRARASRHPVTIRDFFKGWNAAYIRDQLAADKTLGAQPSNQPKEWSEGMSPSIAKSNVSPPSTKDSAPLAPYAAEQDYVLTTWQVEEGLAAELFGRDNQVDPVEYKARKIVYDTVTDEFMPLCDYETLLKARYRVEFEKEKMEKGRIARSHPEPGDE